MKLRILAAASAVALATLAPSAASAAPKPPKPAPATAPVPRTPNYSLTGNVGTVDAGARTLAVVVYGGNARAPRRTTTTFTVPNAAVVTVNGVVAGLADVAPGSRVLVKGVKSGAVVTVTRVEVSTHTAG